MRAFDEDARAVLSVFVSERQLQSKQAAVEALQASLQAPDLLSLDGMSYSAWVCHLAALLLPHTSTHELRACKGMAARRYPSGGPPNNAAMANELQHWCAHLWNGKHHVRTLKACHMWCVAGLTLRGLCCRT